MSQNDVAHLPAARPHRRRAIFILLLGLVLGVGGVVMYLQQLDPGAETAVEIVPEQPTEVATLPSTEILRTETGPLVGPAAEQAAERGTLNELLEEREARAEEARLAEIAATEAAAEAERLAQTVQRLEEETAAAQLRADAEQVPDAGQDAKALAETARLQAEADRLAAETQAARSEADAAQLAAAQLQQSADAIVEQPVLAGDGTDGSDVASVAEQDIPRAETEPAEKLAAVEPESDAAPERPVIGAAGPDAPIVPEFDLIRIDPDGSGLVAGRAAPGSLVQILSDGAVIMTVEASASGEFVAFIQIPDNNEGKVLSLLAEGSDGFSEGITEALILPALEGEGEGDQPLAPTVVTTTPEEVRVVQPSALGQVDGVTLDSISYDEGGDVKLSGRAPGSQPIRIYVDGSSRGVTESTAGGTWNATLDAVDEGRYVLRVDALRPDGSVASRAESPFQRVFPTAEQQRNLKQVTVQPGNSLWIMAEDRYGSGVLYTQIFAANRDAIRDPDLIFPGQIFSLPDEGEFIE
ncbi:MAG: LysM peptidoglycan-binding domain-containing protein [Pseudomonadota bacterium]